MPNQGSASYEEVDDLAHVFRFGYDDLDLADLRIRPTHGGHGMSAETVLPVSTAGTFLPAGASMRYAFD